MRKIIKSLVFFILFGVSFNSAFSIDNQTLAGEQSKQSHINKIGLEILNKNKINKRIIFTYNKNEYKKTLDDKTLTKRQIVFYEEYFRYIENDDELAAFLSCEISRAVKSYGNTWGGLVDAVQVKAAPKKYEIFADKRAVDYMVKAGYNPLGLITFINKSHPQAIADKLLFHNTITKRMAVVYEYIYFNYPKYLENNEYLKNRSYQNFLLVSSSNLAKLNEKVQTNSKKEIKYE